MWQASNTCWVFKITSVGTLGHQGSSLLICFQPIRDVSLTSCTNSLPGTLSRLSLGQPLLTPPGTDRIFWKALLCPRTALSSASALRIPVLPCHSSSCPHFSGVWPRPSPQLGSGAGAGLARSVSPAPHTALGTLVALMNCSFGE